MEQEVKHTASRKFALSIDVEDYFQVWAFSKTIKRERWGDYEFRAGKTTRVCLDILDRHNVKATFFMLGWVAERDPELVQEIVARGHELGSHGYDHVKVNQQTRAEFREDASRTKAILEEISGVQVSGYRAAGFSIDATTPWAYETLAEIGYRYSSSSHPIAHDHYGDASGSQIPFSPIEGDAFLEAPVATTSILGRRVSCAGGGRFRATPASISKALLRRAATSLSGPVIFYFHPWELDPDQPYIHNASMKSKFRHYLNLSQMEDKVVSILSAFSWGRIDDAINMRRRDAL